MTVIPSGFTQYLILLPLLPFSVKITVSPRAKVVEMIRKLLLTGMIIFVDSGSTAQVCHHSDYWNLYIL